MKGRYKIMKRKFLEDLGLKKEVIDSIMEENGKDIENAKENINKLETKVSTLETEKSALQTQVRERDEQLEILKNSADDLEGLKHQIETLQADNKTKDETHAAEIKQLKIDSAVESAITSVRGKNTKAIKALLDLANAEFTEDGCVKGLSEQLETLKKADDSKFLFGTETKQTQFKGAKPGESGNDEGDKSIDISKMSYSQLAAYMAQNPDVKIN